MERLIKPIVCIFFVILSPWFFSFVVYPKSFSPRYLKVITHNDQFYVDEINYLQGLTQNTKISYPAKLIVNRYSMYIRRLMSNYFETYDPKFLYFEGEDDLTKTPFAQGPLLIGTFPFFAFGVNFLVSKKKYRVLLILIISPIVSAFIEKNFDITSRIPFFVCYAWISAAGSEYLNSNKKRLFILITVFYVINLAIFLHNFTVHQPSAVATQLYSR